MQIRADLRHVELGPVGEQRGSPDILAGFVHYIRVLRPVPDRLAEYAGHDAVRRPLHELQGERAADASILAVLGDAGVEVLRSTDDPLIEAFERGIVEAKAITTDICDWENRWSFENLVEQYPGKYSDTLYESLQAGRKLSLEDYRFRLLQRKEAKNRLAAIAPLADALISLGSPGPAPRGLGSTGDSVFNSPTSILGAPAVTVPMLAIEGMPVGIQIVGQRHADARTAGIARGLLETVRPVSVD